MAQQRLASEFKHICANVNPLYSVSPTDNTFVWDFIIFGPIDTLYENGVFPGTITFPKEYPFRPPSVSFNNIFHPNVYQNGQVCISILHEGDDAYGYEKSYERWSPSQNIDTIMLSIISLLSDPNFESPANITASVLWKENPKEYRLRINEIIKK